MFWKWYKWKIKEHGKIAPKKGGSVRVMLVIGQSPININIFMKTYTRCLVLVINKLDSRFVVVLFCSSLVWLQTELDSIRSFYH